MRLCESAHAKGTCCKHHSLASTVAFTVKWCVLFLSRRPDVLGCCAVWTAEEEEGKARTATCPHPQEVEGVQAGGVVTCTVMAAEASVIGVEGLVSLQGGVAEIGVEDHPEAAGTRIPDSMLS